MAANNPIPRRLFRTVISLSAGITLGAVIIAGYAWYQARHASLGYLTLTAATILVVHLTALFFSGRDKNLVPALRLVQGAKMIGAICMPLWIKDHLAVSTLMLAAIPFEVGVVRQLRRMPNFVVLILLSAAAMIGADLLELNHRAVLNEVAYWIKPTGIIVLTIHLLCLVLMLIFRRMLVPIQERDRLDMASQQSLVFASISMISIVLVTLALTRQIRQAQVHQVGTNFTALAEVIAERTGNDLEKQIHSLITLGRREILLEALYRANASYPKEPFAIREDLMEKQTRWLQLPENDPFIISYRNNPQMMELAGFRRANFLHHKLILTDRYGGLVAAQGAKPDHFYYGDLPWWRAAYNSGLSGRTLTDLEMDTVSGTGSIRIAIGLIDPRSNQVIGVLTSLYRLDAIQRDIVSTKNQYAGKLHIISRNGLEIAGPSESLGKVLWQQLTQNQAFQNLDPNDRIKGRWFLGQDHQDRESVIAFAPLFTSSGVNIGPLNELGWYVVFSEPRKNAFVGVLKSQKIAALVGLLATALGVLAATAMIRVIVRPIENLTATAISMREGNLDIKAETVGPRELVTLAESFNSLTERLREMIDDLKNYNRKLEEEVKNRTRKLRKTQRSLIAGAHYSGMAEVAAGVLHNIGNVLNSINISIQEIAKLTQESKTHKLSRVYQLLKENRRQIDEALGEPGRGDKLLDYFQDVLRKVDQEHARIINEINHLNQHVHIVRESVSAQKKYAREATFKEAVDLNEMLGDILDTETHLESRHRIQVIRRFGDIPYVKVSRTKLSYTFLSIIQNAVEAMISLPEDQRVLTIETRGDEDHVKISISDTGIGIPEENLIKIFQYGYTTKEKSLGFGLHTCANSMTEMGGKIEAASEGPGKGAVFHLSLYDVVAERRAG